MSETVYEMMMKLSLDHGALMIGLNQIGNRLVRLAEESAMAKTAIFGLGSMAFGGALLYGLTEVLKTAKEFSKEMTSLQNLGGDMEKLVASGAMDKKVFDIAKITGAKVEDVQKIAGFANSVLNTDNTMASLLALSKFEMLQSGPTSGHKLAIQQLIRSGMITGRITDTKTGEIDMGKLDKFVDEFQRLKSATHGAFNEEVLYGMAKQGGGFLRGLTTEGMEHMAIIAQSLGGPRTGTAFLSTYEQLARGQMTQKTAEGMEAAGLLKQGQWHMEKNVVKLDKDVSRELTAKFGGDPLEIAREIRDNLLAKGITDPQEIMAATANAFGRQTSRRFMAEEVADYQQMIGEGKRIGQAAGVDQATENRLAHDMEFNLTRLQNAWHNLMVAFSDKQSDMFIQVLHGLRDIIVSITDQLKDADPEKLKEFSKGIASLGIVMVGAGMAALLLAIGPMGWLVGGLAAMAAINYDRLYRVIEAIKTVIGWFSVLDAAAPRGDRNLGLPIQRHGIIPRALDYLFPPSVNTDPKIQPQSFEGNGITGPRALPINFNPNNNKQILQPVTLTINLDGHQMAQAFGELAQDAAIHPTGPPDANSWAFFRAMGNQDTA